jgi:hypothetical protein
METVRSNEAVTVLSPESGYTNILTYDLKLLQLHQVNFS